MIKAVSDGTFKGGTVSYYGLKEGGVAAAMDQYNKGLIADDVLKQVDELQGKGHLGRDRRAELLRPEARTEGDGHAADCHAALDRRREVIRYRAARRPRPAASRHRSMTESPTSSTMRDIVKRFGDLVAIHDALSYQAGEVHALVGENGAGKSTLMNILYGLLPRNAGEVLLRGQPVHLPGPAEAIAPASAWCTSISSWRPPSRWPRTSSSAPSRPIVAAASTAQRAERETARAQPQFGLDLDPRRDRRHAAGRSPPARRDPQGTLSRRRDPDPRRAYRRADAAGDARAVRDDALAREQRPLDHLHHPQAARGAGGLGPHLGDAARADRRHARQPGRHRRADRQPDGRAHGAAAGRQGRGQADRRAGCSRSTASRRSAIAARSRSTISRCRCGPARSSVSPACRAMARTSSSRASPASPAGERDDRDLRDTSRPARPAARATRRPRLHSG